MVVAAVMSAVLAKMSHVSVQGRSSITITTAVTKNISPVAITGSAGEYPSLLRPLSLHVQDVVFLGPIPTIRMLRLCGTAIFNVLYHKKERLLKHQPPLKSQAAKGTNNKAPGQTEHIQLILNSVQRIYMLVHFKTLVFSFYATSSRDA